MLRAARLAAKLQFKIDSATEAPIKTLAPLLSNVPEARLFDEMLKLLLSGHSLAGIERLRSLGLHRGLMPVLDQLFDDPSSKPFVTLALQRTDERIAADKGVSPAFLFAALFWFPVRRAAARLEARGIRPLQALHEAMDETLDAQRKTLALPRRLDPLIKEIWIAQPRFEQRSRPKAFRLLALPRFRASYDFLALRSEAGDADVELATWWERFQFGSESEQEAMLLPDDEPKKKKRRRRKKKMPGDGAAPEAAEETGGTEPAQ
jgi:poly(A) polymerase